jgi:hypothetical protein
MRETMDSQEYERLSYYEKWVSSLARILIKKNVISEDELAAAMTEIRGRESPVS